MVLVVLLLLLQDARSNRGDCDTEVPTMRWIRADKPD